MPSKSWSSGDVLNAADVNSILANQVVMTFADSAARDAGFGGAGEPTLGEGMFCMLLDTNAVQVYTGSAWVTIGDPDVLVVDASNGKVGIGQASPVYHLTVEGDNAVQGFVGVFKQLNAGTVPSVIAAIAGNATPAANSYWLACYDSGSVLHGAIAGNGAGVTFYSASDRRLKTNIDDLTGALAIVAGLQPRLFEWVDATDLGVQHGFIADEVADVYPLVVTGDKDAMNPAVDAVLDDDGNELQPAQPETIAPQMIDASKLVPLLTAAIQELSARVAALEAAA